MALKDLTDYLDPDLEIAYRGKTYTAPPPDKDTGLKLAAVNAMGVAVYSAALEECPTCGRKGSPEVPADTLAVIESIKDKDVAELALGAAHAEMVADGVPGPHIDRFGLYALYYWTMGEETADQIFAAQHGGGATGGATSGSSTSPRGPRSASANRTQRRASTRGTGASRRS
ncbi:hypothetical protein CHO01_25190 [Cellulomonas hominis]|uniref:DUF7426 domain-containing protein n=1 Tax=Cellulomonas hominis TaxID=156981 RepID=A0A511FDW8_9CELL|nr:hypothetical protein [Cellulomonas hominis]MBB5472485.1 hypothetical protein [Cellulomonas hominis]NKY05535.1 hypothetical protein [Cellulomonas hominis]GEL47403.1 hypothetical protein CHO01_25190 [Cellulomonas hominis]